MHEIWIHYKSPLLIVTTMKACNVLVLYLCVCVCARVCVCVCAYVCLYSYTSEDSTQRNSWSTMALKRHSNHSPLCVQVKQFVTYSVKSKDKKQKLNNCSAVLRNIAIQSGVCVCVFVWSIFALLALNVNVSSGIVSFVCHTSISANQ